MSTCPSSSPRSIAANLELMANPKAVLVLPTPGGPSNSKMEAGGKPSPASESKESRAGQPDELG